MIKVAILVVWKKKVLLIKEEKYGTLSKYYDIWMKTKQNVFSEPLGNLKQYWNTISPLENV